MLSHSDCDGELTVEESKQIAEGLNEVLANLKPDDVWEKEHLTKRIEQFRDGCLDAVSKGEIVEFR